MPDMTSSPIPHRRALPAWIFAGCGAAVIGVYVTAPASLSGGFYLAVQASSLAAMIVGALRVPDPSTRRPWWSVVAAMVLFLGATIVRIVVPGASPLDPPTLRSFSADLLTVPGYLLLGYGLLSILVRRRAAADEPARADALLVGTVAALAMWALLIAPRFSNHLPTVAVLVVALFPMADVILLTMVARLIMADGVRSASLWLFAVATGSMFVGDLLYSLKVDRLGSATTTLMVMDVVFLSASVAIGAAMLHPTMGALAVAQPVQVRILGPVRKAGISILLIAPFAVIVLVPAPGLWNSIVRLVIFCIIVVTVVDRMANNQNARIRAERSQEHRATHDKLTELPNRELLTETLKTHYAQADAAGCEVSLLFVDLDRFKTINDSLGHSAGDELLLAVADRLRHNVRDTDLVCRIGADEFVVVLASPDHTRLADSMADRMVRVFHQPFDMATTGPRTVTASIGIAHATDADNAEELIRDADTAMYGAKGAGRDGYRAYNPAMREHVRRYSELEQAFRSAGDQGELSVVYQPIIDAITEQPVGCEALMRWIHPELGFVSPVEFIPIAEDTGLILTAGAWLMEEAATQLADWINHRPPDSPALHMSVNVSARQLRNADIIEVVSGVLQRTGLAPQALWLELTESAMLEDADITLGVLTELGNLGCTLCLDDFGTGYSSLTYLKRFPSGIVKIDKSFVSGIGSNADDEAIVQTVITVAHQLGQRVVAEGVETTEQRDWLQERGCDFFQGYLYSPPKPASVIRELILKPQPAPAAQT